MRVIYGTMEIARQMSTFSRHLRGLGVSAATLNYYPTYLKYGSDFEYDLPAQTDQAKLERDTAQIAAAAIQDFDVFHFFFNSTFTPDHSELPLLVKSDRLVCMQHCGSDIRTFEAARRMNPYAVIKTGVDEAASRRKLEAIAKHIRVAVIANHRLHAYIEGVYDKVHVVPGAFDLTDYTIATEHEHNPRPLVVHAPTSPQYKGTEYVMRAVETLKRKLDFDFQLVQGLDHEAAKAVYRRADVIVDQLLGGGYGALTLECMAMGKTVVVWIAPSAAAIYPEEVPVVSANPDNIAERLEVAICDADLRRSLAPRARAYMEKFHDARRIARTLKAIYEGRDWDASPVQSWWGYDG